MVALLGRRGCRFGLPVFPLRALPRGMAVARGCVLLLLALRLLCEPSERTLQVLLSPQKEAAHECVRAVAIDDEHGEFSHSPYSYSFPTAQSRPECFLISAADFLSSPAGSKISRAA
jgi:hypothetical protein